MECLSCFASAIARDLVCGAVDQLRYPCCFNSFVEDLQKKEDKLTTTINSVEDRVKHAKKQAIKNADVFDEWLEEANPLKNDVEDLLKKTKTNKSYCLWHCPNWIWRYGVGKKLAKKKVNIEKCIEKGSEFIQLERVATLPSGMPDIPSEKCLKFDSRQSAYKQLMEALEDDEVAMIGLYGMGGCGKTTLVMEVKKRAEAEHLFDIVLFVPVSSVVEVERIQDKIASPLQFTFPENEVREKAQRLCKRLTEVNRILVILDDVWEKLDFGAIGIPSGEHHRGCKVLITTRSVDVCTLMDCQRKIPLEILTDEEAWALFRDHAYIFEGTSDSLKHLARLISNECEGLPVAITAVASTLKGKAEVEWKVALERLKNSKPVRIEKGLQNPYKCLQLSYDNLDNEEAKSLFLLCSVFPEDYEIEVEWLTRFAIGLGLVGEVCSYEGARNEVSATKNKLLNSCLLLDANEGECVKMHDLIHDVAQLIAKEKNEVIKCALKEDVKVDSKSLRYLWCRKMPNQLDCSNLEFLYIGTWFEASHEIFKGMGKLRVLFLPSFAKRWPLSMLSFKSLTNLRYLYLRRWELSDMSFVGDMKKLECLTLVECSFLELPNNVVVTQLTNLKLLELIECDMKRNNFEVIGKLPQLEELYIDDPRSEWDVYNESSAEFFNKFSIPQALLRYRIQLGTVYDHAKELFHKALSLRCFHTSNVAIKGLAKNAEALFIANIQGGAKNIIPEIFQIEVGYKNEWKELVISDSKEIECLIDASNHLSEVGNIFSNLLKLGIDRVEHLGALCRGCLPPGGPFKNLEELFLCGCPELTTLFTPGIVQSLIQLEKLEIFGCDGLKHVLADDDTNEISTDQRLVFAKLRWLKVICCDKLEYVIPVTFAEGLLQLESLLIDDCSMLKYIFGPCTQGDRSQNELKIELPALEKLTLSRCGELKFVFSACIAGGLPQLKMLNIRACNQLDQITEDEERQHFLESTQLEYSPESTPTPSALLVNHDSGSFTLSSLTSLELESCPKLGSLFTASAAKTLTSLEELRIVKCRGLKQILTYERANKNQKEEIAEDDHDFQSYISMFPSLKMLYITGCDLLQHIFPVPLRYLPELNHLEIRECKELKQIIEEDVENQKFSNLSPLPLPCFPKLATLVFQQCHKLKRFISVSACNDLPNLELLIINGASELEELIGCEQGQGDDEIGKVKIELPKLKLLIFMQLSNLCHGTELLNVRHRVIHNCPKLSLTPTATLQEFMEELESGKEDLEIIGLYKRGLFYKQIASLNSGKKLVLKVDLSSNSMKHNAIRIAASFSGVESFSVDMEDKKMMLLGHEDPVVVVHKLRKICDTYIYSIGPANYKDPKKCLMSLLEEGTTSDNVTIVTSSTDSDSASSQSGPLVASQRTSDTHEWDPMLETNSQLQMNHEDPAIFESELPSSQVNGTNQSILGNLAGMLHEHNQIESRTTASKSYELLESERESEGRLHLQSLGQKLSPISSPKLRECLKETWDQSIQEGSKSEKNVTKTLSTNSETRNTSPGPLLAPLQKSIERGVEEGSTSETTKIITSSSHSDPANSQSGPLVTPQHKSFPNSGKLSQTETYTDKESEGHPINIQDFGDDDLISLFQPVEEDSGGQTLTTSVSVVPAVTEDNLVVKVLADLEEFLKMPLKDIASSESNSLRLLTALNFLSRLSLEHVTLSDGLKAIIDSLQQEFPSILCSFKQAFATTNKFVVLEQKEISVKEELAHRNEVAITLVSKISKAKNFMDEAQQKEAILKEQMNRLEKEIKDCEADLLSLQEEKKKFVAETIGLKKEFETVRNDKSQMVEDQRKALQELSEVDYKWSVLCSQFEYNRIATRNLS